MQQPARQTAALPPGEAAALAPQHQGDVSFVSGGTGLEDRAALRAIAGDYNMRLMFAVRPSGEYLADVAVTLADPRGETVLSTVANGPFFYAHVRPGRYSLTVSSNGRTQTRTIEIGANGAVSQPFYWQHAG